jgi:hypothetical protein
MVVGAIGYLVSGSSPSRPLSAVLSKIWVATFWKRFNIFPSGNSRGQPRWYDFTTSTLRGARRLVAKSSNPACFYGFQEPEELLRPAMLMTAVCVSWSWCLWHVPWIHT